MFHSEFDCIPLVFSLNTQQFSYIFLIFSFGYKALIFVAKWGAQCSTPCYTFLWPFEPIKSSPNQPITTGNQFERSKRQSKKLLLISDHINITFWKQGIISACKNVYRIILKMFAIFHFRNFPHFPNFHFPSTIFYSIVDRHFTFSHTNTHIFVLTTIFNSLRINRRNKWILSTKNKHIRGFIANYIGDHNKDSLWNIKIAIMRYYKMVEEYPWSSSLYEDKALNISCKTRPRNK